MSSPDAVFFVLALVSSCNSHPSSILQSLTLKEPILIRIFFFFLYCVLIFSSFEFEDQSVVVWNICLCLLLLASICAGS